MLSKKAFPSFPLLRLTKVMLAFVSAHTRSVSDGLSPLTGAAFEASGLTFSSRSRQLRIERGVRGQSVDKDDSWHHAPGIEPHIPARASPERVAKEEAILCVPKRWRSPSMS